jgi:hypothetical protein
MRIVLIFVGPMFLSTLLADLAALMPSLLLGIAAATSLADALALIARHTFRHRPGISKQRKPRSKPHKSMTQKPC